MPWFASPTLLPDPLSPLPNFTPTSSKRSAALLAITLSPRCVTTCPSCEPRPSSRNCPTLGDIVCSAAVIPFALSSSSSLNVSTHRLPPASSPHSAAIPYCSSRGGRNSTAFISGSSMISSGSSKLSDLKPHQNHPNREQNSRCAIYKRLSRPQILKLHPFRLSRLIAGTLAAGHM